MSAQLAGPRAPAVYPPDGGRRLRAGSAGGIAAPRAPVAQLEEHLICNQGVGGSSPSGGTASPVLAARPAPLPWPFGRSRRRRPDRTGHHRTCAAPPFRPVREGGRTDRSRASAARRAPRPPRARGSAGPSWDALSRRFPSVADPRCGPIQVGRDTREIATGRPVRHRRAGRVFGLSRHGGRTPGAGPARPRGAGVRVSLRTGRRGRRPGGRAWPAGDRLGAGPSPRNGRRSRSRWSCG